MTDTRKFTPAAYGTPEPLFINTGEWTDAERQKFLEEWKAAAGNCTTAIAAGKVEPGQPVYSDDDGRVRALPQGRMDIDEIREHEKT